MSIKEKTRLKGSRLKKKSRIKNPDFNKLEVVIKGESPLLFNKHDENYIYTYSDKNNPEAPEEDFTKKCHWMDFEKRIPGIPTFGFLQGMIGIAKSKFPSVTYVTATQVSGSVKTLDDFVELFPAAKNEPYPLSRWGKIGLRGTPTEIKRPAFSPGWKTKITFAYVKGVISADTIVKLLNQAGYQYGIGSFSPRCMGTFGRYSVESSQVKTVYK
jgi:hypothetical protein